MRKERIEKDFETILKGLATELGELNNLFQSDTREKELLRIPSKTRNTLQILRNPWKHIRETIANLRVKIKYLLLDLEATRRENDQLKKLLKEKN